MHRKRQLVGLVVAGCLAVGGTGRTEESVPATPARPGARTAPVSTCLEELRVVSELVNRLEAEARAAGQADRLDCIVGVQARLKGLKQWTEAAQARLKEAATQDDSAAMEAATTQIQVTCERAERLAVEAANCAAVVPPKKPQKRPLPHPVVKEPPPRRQMPVTELPRRQTALARNRETCLTQGQLAVLLTRAMGLPSVENQSSQSCVAELTRREIKPAGGWQPGNCAQLRDLYALLCQILKLTSVNLQDESACVRALREEGLPVDLYLPAAAPAQESPLLLEPEVREFLSQGLTAPLPSSSPVPPE